METKMENEKFYEDELQEKLDALKKNRELIPESDLLGKYRKAYDKLIAEIWNIALKVFDDKVRFLIPKDIVEPIKKKYCELMEKNMSAMTTALYNDYDTDKFCDICHYIYSDLVTTIFALEPDWTLKERYTLTGQYICTIK